MICGQPCPDWLDDGRGALAPFDESPDKADTRGREESMLRIWGRTNSTNVQKVLWCAAELGLDYERIDAGAQYGVTDTPEYRAMNPNALVPTIDDDGFILWESNVIVRYLAKRHSDGKLFPADTRERFIAEQWMDWQATALWPGFRDAFWGLVRTPPEKRDQAAISKSQQQTAKRLGGLETRLGKAKFVAGDGFTMGDIPVGVAIYRCLALGINRADFPNIGRWYDSLTEHGPFREHVMLPIT
jgi:glutathione S-transferase